MPTIGQLPAAVSVGQSDGIPIYQNGATVVATAEQFGAIPQTGDVSAATVIADGTSASVALKDIFSGVNGQHGVPGMYFVRNDGQGNYYVYSVTGADGNGDPATYLNVQQASPRNASILGDGGATHNTSTRYSGVGFRRDYFTSNVSGPGGFDGAAAFYSYALGLSTTGNQYICGTSYISSSYDTGTTGMGGTYNWEYNVNNNGQDLGWYSTRMTDQWWVGNVQLVPEISNGYGAAPANYGRDILFHTMISQSGDTSSTLNRPVRAHNGHLLELDGLTTQGRFLCGSGGSVLANAPYAWGQALGYWQYGIRFDDAAITGGNALVLNSSQNITFSDTPANPSSLGTVRLIVNQAGGNLAVNTSFSAPNMPTSPAGLTSGQMWRNGNVVNIV